MSEVDLQRRLTAAPHVRPYRPGVQREADSPQLPIPLMDGATRQRYALGLQRTAGNGAVSQVAGKQVQRETPAASEWDIGPNPYATTEKGGGAVTEVGANPYAVENDPVTLANPRFVGEPRLEKEKYRIWLFEACTTIAYFDELRGGILPENVDRSNLDLMGTRTPAPLDTEMASSLAMIDGILSAQTIEQVTEAMDKAGAKAAKAVKGISEADRQELVKYTRNLNVHEGAGDNPIAPATP